MTQDRRHHTVIQGKYECIQCGFAAEVRTTCTENMYVFIKTVTNVDVK